MPQKNEPSIDIGMEFLKNIYTKSDVQTKEAQPIYILHRDTIKAFLHEKLNLFGAYSKLFGLIGIEITILISLVTATFNDLFGITGDMVEGTFIAFLFIIWYFILKDCLSLWNNRGKLSVDYLTNDLGERGSIIKPSESKSESG